jgi:CHASE3 domain sensor protein
LASACKGESATRSEQAMYVSVPTATVNAAAIQAPVSAVASYWATQKLIRTAELQIEVKDVGKAMLAVDSMVKQRGALVADSKQSVDAHDWRSTELMIRVPSDRFLDALGALRQVGKVKSESVKTEDVTKDYADVETRLAVKEQTVTRLRALLDSRAAKLSDVLEVERELARSVTELEQMKGEKRFYDQRIAISTITLTLFDHTTSRGVQFTEPVANAFRSAVGIFATSISAIVSVVAYLLPWVVLALLLWRPLKWLKARSTTP